MPISALQPVAVIQVGPPFAGHLHTSPGVLVPAVRAQYILEEAGNSQPWVNLEQSRRQFLRFLVIPNKCTTCCSDTQSGVAMRQLSQCHFCPGHGFIMPSRKEMSMRHTFMHCEGERINRTQSHSMLKALDGPIRFAEPHFDHAAVNRTE